MGQYLMQKYDESLEKSTLPLVSVIIPVYNVEKYIKQALDSVVNQTLKNIEIICVNDGSVDNSFEIVKKYAQIDSRFVLLEQKNNLGQGVARNSALEIARGDYIMFLDPDDYYELNACEEAYNQISKNKNDIVFFNLHYFKEKFGKEYKKISQEREKIFNILANNTDLKLYELEVNLIISAWVWCQIYSRDFIKANNIKFSEGRFGEDLVFFIKSFIESKSSSVLNKALYNYRTLGQNKKSINYSEYYNDGFIAKENCYNLIRNSKNRDVFLKKYIKYLIDSNIFWLKTFAKHNKHLQEEVYAKNRKIFKTFIKEVNVNDLLDCKFYKDFILILENENYKEFKKRITLLKFLNLY